MPWSPQFSSPCLQISKSPPDLRKPSFLWTAACTATWLSPDKRQAVTAAGMWSSTGARTESCCGSCVVRVLFHCALKKSLFLTNSAVCRLGPVYILQANHHGPLTQFCSQKNHVFACWRQRGTNTPARISSGSWCCGQLWCSRGSGVFFHFIRASNANTGFVFHVKICWAKIYSCTLTLVDCILCKYLTCLLLPCSL